MTSWARVVAVAVVMLAGAGAARAAGLVDVAVRDNAGQPLPGVTVSLVEAGREGLTGEAGTYRFENVPDGSYHVGARLAGFAGTRAEVSVTGAAASVALKLGTQVHFTESVTVSPGGRDTFESYQPTSVLGAEDLQQRLGGSLGETLRTQVGVNVRAFGPGPARPVIRGLDGDRVLVLENGARTGDLSSQSADHGVTLDPAGASQIEVVRGPATLLYGSNALGGVVNVVSDDIPARPLDGLRGAFTAQGGTADDEAALPERENLRARLGGDGVRGERRDGGGALPRIPPYRGWVGLRFQKGGFHLEGELRGVARQERVYGAETPTPGYALVSLHGSYTVTTGRSAHTVTLRLDNAADRLYRNHLSYIKDLAPELGRSLKLVYGVRF